MKNYLSAAVLLVSIFFSHLVYAQSNSAEFISLKGDSFFPEGILGLKNGDLLVGGFGDGSIQRINKQKELSYFSEPGQNGMVIAVGMAVDEKNNRLWVANFNFKTKTGRPGSNLKVFDLKSFKLIKTIPEDFMDGVFFNEIAIDEKANVYVTNTFGPQIFTANFESESASLFVESDLFINPAPDQPFDLNGLAITPDNDYLIASVMDRLDAGGGRLVRINLSTKEVKTITLEGGQAVEAFAGSDGMFFHGDTLYMVNVYAKAGAIITAGFTKDYSVATLHLHLENNTIYDRPTASALVNGRLYTVNSQLNHIIDDGDGELNTRPSLPFKIVSVPLSDFRD